MGVEGRGRRGALHRVPPRRPTRPGSRAPGGAPHPRPQRREEEGRWTGHPVRHLALPRLLHHHRPCRLDTVAADKTHRGHAIIEQVHADLKSSALAHLPSGKIHRQRRLARAGRHRVQPHPHRGHHHRQRPRQSHHRHHPRETDHRPSPGGVLGRRVTLHLPTAWPWETAWTRLFTHGCGPRQHRSLPDHPALTARPELETEHPDSEVRRTALPSSHHHGPGRTAHPPRPSVDRGLWRGLLAYSVGEVNEALCGRLGRSPSSTSTVTEPKWFMGRERTVRISGLGAERVFPDKVVAGLQVHNSDSSHATDPGAWPPVWLSVNVYPR